MFPRMPGFKNFKDVGISRILDSHDSGIPGIRGIPEIDSGIPETLLDSRIARIPRCLVVFSLIFFRVSVTVFVADRHLH